MRRRVPVLVELRRRVDHPGVDEHETIRMVDRVDEARPGHAVPEHFAAEVYLDHGRRLSCVIEVRSPYSGEVVGTVESSSAADARGAVDAAAKALESPLPAHERAAILDRTAALLRDRQEEMAQTICAEAGKPIKTARVEASRAVSTYTFAAVEARKLAGDVVPMEASEAGAGKIAFTLRRPIGVIGAISPFNFPCNLVAHKLAPALAAGCPVVLKPASATPLSACFLAGLEQEAGLPPGWLNVVA